ncbi:MAG: serine/threonine-protein kinase [archaeon]
MGRIGNYEIIKQISEGGFGRIYQAKHIFLDELACIKQNKEDTDMDIQILRQEAKLLWKLDEYHSIPSAKDFFKVAKGSYALVMSYIDGKTLDETIPKNKKMNPEDVCWITERLLGALHYLHYNGVIHADVKPQNVIIEPKKHDIKLIDFGLSSYMPKSITKPLGYTEVYAAPELILLKPPIPETDLYGAGVVMLTALGGDIYTKSLPKTVHKDIADFCNKLLRYDPKERPNWDKNNPLLELSDIRQHVFGRKHVSEA